MSRGLYRGYNNLQILRWLADDEFVGTIDSRFNGTLACYGWSKGKGFMVYSIEEGHIMKLGTVDREAVFDISTP